MRAAADDHSSQCGYGGEAIEAFNLILIKVTCITYLAFNSIWKKWLIIENHHSVWLRQGLILIRFTYTPGEQCLPELGFMPEILT